MKETVPVPFTDPDGNKYMMNIPKEELEKGPEMDWHFTPADIEELQ